MKKYFGLEIPTSIEELFVDGRLALLIYDMQAGIVSQIEDADLIVDRVRQVLAAARKAQMRIFFTRHMSCPRS